MWGRHSSLSRCAHRPDSEVVQRACCEHCGGGFLHELIRVRIEADGGAWTLCAGCAIAALDRLSRAHVEAGAQLESLWLIGEGAA